MKQNKVVAAAYTILFASAFIGVGIIEFAPRESSMTMAMTTPTLNATATPTATNLPYNTPTLVPTATVNKQSTLDIALTAVRGTEVKLDDINLQIIQESNRQKDLDNQAASIELENNKTIAQIQDAAISASQTAYAPMATTTQAATILEIAKINDKANEAQRIIDIARAQEVAKNEPWIMFVELAGKTLAFSTLALMLIYMFFTAIIREIAKARKMMLPTPVEAARANGLKPIPFVSEPDNANQSRRIDPEIPCTKSAFFALAEGVTVEKKTLAYGQWVGTEVHKFMEDLRRWFVDNHFAAEIPSKGGELMIIKDGRSLLKEVYASQEIPEPFTWLEG